MSEIKCPRCKKTYIAIDDEETLFGPALLVVVLQKMFIPRIIFVMYVVIK